MGEVHKKKILSHELPPASHDFSALWAIKRKSSLGQGNHQLSQQWTTGIVRAVKYGKASMYVSNELYVNNVHKPTASTAYILLIIQVKLFGYLPETYASDSPVRN